MVICALCVCVGCLSSPISFSSLFCRSSSSPSRRPSPLSTRSSCPKACATSARGPWSVMTTRHPAQKSWMSSPDCRVDGRAADSVSACSQVKMKDAHKLLKIPESECPDILDSSTTTQMAKIMVQYGRPSCSSRAESVRSSFGRTIMGKAI